MTSAVADGAGECVNLWKCELAGVTSEYNEIRIREAIGELPEHFHLLESNTPISTLSLFRMARCLHHRVPQLRMRKCPASGFQSSPPAPAATAASDSRSTTTASTTIARLHTVPRLGAAAVHRAKVHAGALMARRPRGIQQLSCDGRLRRDRSAVPESSCRRQELRGNRRQWRPRRIRRPDHEPRRRRLSFCGFAGHGQGRPGVFGAGADAMMVAVRCPAAMVDDADCGGVRNSFVHAPGPAPSVRCGSATISRARTESALFREELRRAGPTHLMPRARSRK
jgi:hypothetical protein